MRSHLGVTVFLVTAAACACARPVTAPSRWQYPTTRTVNVVDDYHGTKVADAYRWLEDLESEEVRAWASAQTAVAEPLLRKNDLHPWLRARIDELGIAWDAFDEATREPPQVPPIDGRTLGEGKTIEGTWPSPDKKFAAYAVSDRGSDWQETRIRRLGDGKDLDERLSGWLWSDAEWTKDSRGFFYVRSVRPAAGERTMMKSPGVFYHVAGTPQSSDVAVFSTPDTTTDLVVETSLSKDGRFLFIYEGNGADVDQIGWMLTRMHVIDLVDPRRPQLSGAVVPLTPGRDAAYRVIASEGDTLYVFTDRDAPRRRLVAIDVKNPGLDRWRNVIAQSDDVLERIHDVNGRWVAVYLRNVQNGVRVFERDGRPVRELTIPPMSSVLRVRAGAGTNELQVGITGLLSAPTNTLHNLSTGVQSVTPPPPLPFNAADFEVKQVWYASKDGTRVPMFLMHRRGLARDRSHPLMLGGYGASGSVGKPSFSEPLIAALELGLVMAFPSLRGGGEFGRAWYDAATLDRKQNTFDDFIAAAEYLIAEGYTRADRLGIAGSSNGGLLVTAVITQRPDLFRVAVADVPQTDALRYDRGRHIPQFGTASNPAHFPFLYAYSPQHRVKAGTCYPSTLLTTALNDDRSPAWMAMKFAAALQAAQSCDRPVILRADTGGGHGGDFLTDASDTVAFIATELGLKAPAAAPAAVR